MSDVTSTRAVLDGLFRPRSVAVFGSASAGKLGHTVVRNLRAWGFDGAIYPINREGAAIDGLAGYASLDAVPLDREALEEVTRFLSFDELLRLARKIDPGQAERLIAKDVREPRPALDFSDACNSMYVPMMM